jgi:acylphosphatase
MAAMRFSIGLVACLAGAIWAAEPATRPASRPATQPATRAAMRRVHVYVSGNVQGVGFRAFTQESADELALVGWVRNLADGRVEAEIEGPSDRVADLLGKIKHGPALARVDKVEVSEERPLESEHRFSVKY